MIRHLTVLGGFVGALALALAAWAGLTAIGADRAGPDARLLVAHDAPDAFAHLVAAGVRPIDGPIAGTLWIVAADGPGSAQALRAQGASLVLVQPIGQVWGFGGCAPMPGLADLRRALGAG